MSNAQDIRNTVGQATYTNKVTKQTYTLGFFFADNSSETELSRAWDLVSTAATLNGWPAADITVKAGNQQHTPETETVTTRREACREAIIDEAQSAFETTVATTCYRTLTAKSDGTVDWREHTDKRETGEAEYFGRVRDCWTLQTFGTPGIGHNGNDSDIYVMDDSNNVTDEILEYSDAGIEAEELLAEAIATDIPVGFFDDEEPGDECNGWNLYYDE